MTKIPLHTIERDEGIERGFTLGEEAGRYLWKPRRAIPKGARNIGFHSSNHEPEITPRCEELGGGENATVQISTDTHMKLPHALTHVIPFHRGIVHDTLVAYREIRFPHVKRVPDILSHIVAISGGGKDIKIQASQSDLRDFLDLDVCVYSCIDLGNEDFETMRPLYEGKLGGVYDPELVEMDEYLRPKFHGVTHVLHFPQTYGQKIALTKAKTIADVRGLLTQADTPPKRALFTGDFHLPDTPPESNLNALNASQNRALALAKDIERYPVVFIHGPSGTGKTETVAKILEEHLRAGRRICVLSHSNRGFQMPLSRLLQMHPGLAPQIGIYALPKSIPEVLKGSIIPRKTPGPENERTRKNIRKDLGIDERKQFDRWSRYRSDFYEETYGYEAWKQQKGIYNEHVVGLTFDTLQFASEIQDAGFDVVIVDEATRMQAPELLRALQIAKKQIIFVGDPLQLGNIQATADELGEIHPSLARIYEKGPFPLFIQETQNPEENLPYVFLNTNYRSRPNLTAIVSGLIYDGKLQSGNKSQPGEAVWYDTSRMTGSSEKKDGTSKVNLTEVRLVVDKLLYLLKKKGLSPNEIGIIATYRAQAEKIKRLLEKKLAYSTPENKALYEEIIKNIGTVDSFQGDERKVMIISLTRSNSEGRVGFLSNEARLGVALGRAQEAMYVFGNRSTLIDKQNPSEPFFSNMHHLFMEHGTVRMVENT